MATTPPPPLTPEERLARLEGVYDHLATQGHIGEVKAEISEVKAEMEARIGEVKAEIGEVKAEIARVEGDLKAEIADLKGSFRTLLIAVSAGLALLNIILRFWPS